MHSEAAVTKTQVKLKNVVLPSITISGPLHDADVSYDAMVQNNLQALEKEIPTTSFEAEMKSRNLDEEFDLLERLTYLKPHKERFNTDATVQPLNRYIDILPFNDTRVVLQQKDGYAEHTTYINANYVHSPLGPDRKLIAAQGPKANTVDHFWRMVAEQNVTLIISVCKLEEGGRPKCHKYWPEGDSDTDPAFKKILFTAGLKIKQVGAKRIGKTLDQRNFEVITADGKTQKVTQVHYTGWPDHGVPTGESMDEFTVVLNELILMILNSDSSEKAVIHCSAGIGRTGTTAALAHLMINIASQVNSGKVSVKDGGVKLSVFSTVRRLREQRFSMVQMPEQYKFIYSYLNYWLKVNKFNL